jgi:hypothetical protein
MQAGVFPAVSGVGQEAFVRDLGGGLAAAISDVEASNRADAIGGIAQGRKRLFQPEPKRANHSCCNDYHPGASICSVQNVKSSHTRPFLPAILVAFETEALYTMSPKGENSSLEVRRLSVGIHSTAI